MALDCAPTKYTPQWTEDGWTDVSPLEKGQRRLPTPYVCTCRRKQDTFSTYSEFQLHIKHKYHTEWVRDYDMTISEDTKRMIVENRRLSKINALLHANVEKLEARIGHLDLTIQRLQDNERKLKLDLEQQGVRLRSTIAFYDAF